MGATITPSDIKSILNLVEKMEQELVCNVAARLADMPKEMKLISRQIREESSRLDLFSPNSKDYDDIAFNLRMLENKRMSTTSEWRLKQLGELGKLNKQNIDTIAKYSDKTTDELNAMLNSIGISSVESDEKAYQEAYKLGVITNKAIPIAMSERIAETLKAGIRNANDVMNLVNTTAAEAANTAFITAINKSYLETVTGTKTFESAVRDSVDVMAKKGITGATYKSGNRILNYSLDAAVRMNITTTVNNTLRELQFARMDDWGWDLIEVSSHAGARPKCAPFQGKIYSRNGKNKEYPLLSNTSYGQPDGLFGINCHHSFFPFLPGVNTPSFSHDPAADVGKDNEQILPGVNTPSFSHDPAADVGKDNEQMYKDNEQMYKEQQQQRNMERDIRKEKRVYLAGKAADDNELMTKASVRLKEKEKSLTEFLSDTGRKRYAERQQLNGFGRKEAANARKLYDLKRRDDIIISEIKEIGIKEKIHLTPTIIDIDSLKFDVEHIVDRHKVTESEAKSFIKNAEISITKWGGQYEQYYSKDGAAYVNIEKKLIRTAYKKDEFDEKIQKLMEVLGNER